MRDDLHRQLSKAALTVTEARANAKTASAVYMGAKIRKAIAELKVALTIVDKE